MDVPKDFEWVKLRAKCSAVEMFEVLRSAAKSDTATRNAIHNQGEPENRFGFNDHISGERSFKVFDNWGSKRRSADFVLNSNTLHVTLDPGDDFTATLTLTDDGHCKFKVKDDELFPWQLLRRALEGLFFNG